MTWDLSESNALRIPLDMGARVRVRPSVLEDLGWNTHTEDFECYGVLRAPEEILVAPEWLKTEDEGIHPLQHAYDAVERMKSAPAVDLLAIPALDVLALRYRVFRFPARWCPPKKVQLDLNIGAKLVGRLSAGMSAERKNPRAFAVTYGGMLVLASERWGAEIMKTDLAQLL